VRKSSESEIWKYVFYKSRPFDYFSWSLPQGCDHISCSCFVSVRGVDASTRGFSVHFPVDTDPETQLEYFGGLLVHKPLYSVVNQFVWKRDHAPARVATVVPSSVQGLVSADPQDPVNRIINEGIKGQYMAMSSSSRDVPFTRLRWHLQISWIVSKLNSTSLSWIFGRDHIQRYFDGRLEDDQLVLVGKRELIGISCAIRFSDVEGSVYRTLRRLDRLMEVNGSLLSRVRNPQSGLVQVCREYMSILRVRYPVNEITLVHPDRLEDATIIVFDDEDCSAEFSVLAFSRTGVVPDGVFQ